MFASTNMPVHAPATPQRLPLIRWTKTRLGHVAANPMGSRKPTASEVPRVSPSERKALSTVSNQTAATRAEAMPTAKQAKSQYDCGRGIDIFPSLALRGKSAMGSKAASDASAGSRSSR